MPDDQMTAAETYTGLQEEVAKLRAAVVYLSTKNRRYYEENHGVRFVLRDVEEQCARLRRAVRLGGELEGALLDAPDDGDRIGSRLLAFSAAYVVCEEHGDLGAPEGEAGVS